MMRNAGIGLPEHPRLREGVKRFFYENTSILYLLAMFALACAFVPRFAQVGNWILIIRQSSIPVISCVAMAFVLATGNSDLSTGFLVGLVSSVCGILVKQWSLPSGLSVLLCLGIGLAAGAINGALVAFLRIPSFIATLGSGFVLFGFAQIVGGSNSINQLPVGFLNLGNYELFGLPLMVYYALLVVAAGAFVMRKTTFGRGLISIGLNSRTCFLSGIRTQHSILITYVASGALTALCSVLLTIRVNCAQPDMGGGNFAFEAITAAVLGGTSLMGGKVNIVCCALGVVMVKIIENCINLSNMNYYLYQAVLGFVIMIALVAEAFKTKSER